MDETEDIEISGEFQKRLKTLIGEDSVSAFARRAGESEGTIRSYLRGVTPGLDKVIKLARANGVSVLWLAAGQGPKQETEMRALLRVSGNEDVIRAVDRERCDPSEFVLLPRYNVRAAAGAGAVIESERIVDYLAFKAEWVRRTLGAAPRNLLLIEAWGDSMEPTVRHGDLLLIDTSEPRVRDNAIYALLIEGDLVVKRVQRKLDGALVVRSDNEAYPPEEIPAAESARLSVVGRVRWFGRSL